MCIYIMLGIASVAVGVELRICSRMTMIATSRKVGFVGAMF